MASFTPPTYDMIYKNELGKFGLSWPIGKAVYILDADDSVVETSSFVDPTDVNLMKAGSGDFGKALFRRGITYTITAGEETILVAAGYTVT